MIIFHNFTAQAAGLPLPPPMHLTSCWANVGLRHVAQMAVAGAAVLATVTMYIQVATVHS